MQPAFLIGIGVYVVIVVAISLVAGKRTKQNSHGFFLAGKSLPWYLICAGLVSQAVGGGSTIGLAAGAYDDGYAAFWTLGPIVLGMVAMAFLLAKPLSRMTQVTHPEILEERYSVTSGVTATIFYITQSISGVGVQLLAMGSLLALVTGWPVLLCAALSAAIILVWVLLGGMLGTSWGDVLHWLIFMVGLAIMVPLTISHAGGLHRLTSTPGLSAGFGDPFHIAPTDALAGALLIAPTALALQAYFQRLLGARSEKDGRNGVLLAALLMLPVYIVVPLLGIAGKYLFPHIGSSDSVFPRLMIHEFPLPVGVLLYAAVASALMSSAGGTTLSAASNITQDIYVRLVNPQASGQRQLLVGRLSVVALIVLSFLLLWSIPSILDLLLFGFYGVVGGVLIPWLCALYWPRVTTKAANASMIVGGGVSIVLYFYEERTGAPLAGIEPIFAGLALALLITIGGSLLDKPEREKHERFLVDNHIRPARADTAVPSATAAGL